MQVMQTTVTKPSDINFLYPKSRKFPIDEVCEKIVRALEKRNWKAPGIEVTFRNYGNEMQYRYVSLIESKDFKLWFCRQQGDVSSDLYDIAAVSELVIPRQELTVYDDESGPTYVTYVGDDWDEDRESFMHGTKIHSKLLGKPRTYLQYSGSIYKDVWAGNGSNRRPFLVNHDDDGREYKAIPGEPTYFHTDKVLRIFTEWLNTNVLQKIVEINESPGIELAT